MEKLGDIGTLRGGASDYALIWRVVSEAHIPLEDIEKNWSFERLMSFGSFLSMKQDYKSAWGEFYEKDLGGKNGK